MANIYVSEHALIRYIERKLDCNLDAFREEIRAVVRSAVEARASKIYVGGFTYVLNGTNVVTVLEGRKREPTKAGGPR